jgi:hypothetical protein
MVKAQLILCFPAAVASAICSKQAVLLRKHVSVVTKIEHPSTCNLRICYAVVTKDPLNKHFHSTIFINTLKLLLMRRYTNAMIQIKDSI